MYAKNKFLLKKGSITLGVLLGLALAGGAYNGSRYLWGKNISLFVKGIARDGLTVGALSPCSTFVAKACTKYIAAHEGPKNILEVGAGCGAVTREIFKHVQDKDSLDIVEINEEYVLALNQQFGYKKEVDIYCQDVTTWKTDKRYDYIVSTVPFTNIPLEVIKKIIKKYKKLIKPGGIISYVELGGIAKVREIALRVNKKLGLFDDCKKALKVFKAKRELMSSLREEYLFDSEHITANLPPIWVYHLKIDK
ncbi:methyltransferase domain-containing protein [bacterium]|mgnify:CR=1 FL=1|jgi:phosphatidylethanolamine/phosphatidyl-N-methylethanolamine N-methyltransferase|nr:methyltransferase domain-containing protein [bacterium]